MAEKTGMESVPKIDTKVESFKQQGTASQDLDALSLCCISILCLFLFKCL